MPIKKHHEVIGPERAKELLRLNTANFRNLNERKVNDYARAMRAGVWQYNGDVIRISQSGVLLDGQHRLHACLQSGAVFETDIVEGLLDDCVKTLGTGIPRKVADYLSYLNIPNAKDTATVVRDIIGIIRTNHYRRHTHSISPTETEPFYVTYGKQIQKTIAQVRKGNSAGSRWFGSNVASILFFASLVRPDIIEELIGYMSGAYGIKEGCPLSMYALMMSKNQSNTKKLPPSTVRALLIKVINVWAVGESRGNLKFSSKEKYPILLNLSPRDLLWHVEHGE